jgi:uncharacterized protein (TIGR02646 family)
MRPVDKGHAPQAYLAYGEAQPDLVAALGRYCSYCGRFIAEGIAVEHKRPKTRYPNEQLIWSNFLLACSNCNSCKGHPRVRLNAYLWPDTDNTLLAICYGTGGLVHSARALSKRVRRTTNRTIRLLGLDRHPGSYRRPSDRDYRWLDRKNQWEKAVLFREQLGVYDTPEQRAAIVLAANDGIFSIWWCVFTGDVDMRRRLRLAFPGTAASCFDRNENLMARVGGQV